MIAIVLLLGLVLAMMWRVYRHHERSIAVPDEPALVRYGAAAASAASIDAPDVVLGTPTAHQSGMNLAPKFTKIIASAALVTALAVVPASAAVPEARNITAQFAANAPDVERLQVFEVGGVVILRGRTYERSAAEAAARTVQAQGYSRIANLIQIIEAPNDVTIQREAERELAIHRSLAGSQLSVESEKGIIYLRGRIQHDLQKDIAVAVLRSVEGVREVRSELIRN